MLFTYTIVSIHHDEHKRGSMLTLRGSDGELVRCFMSHWVAKDQRFNVGDQLVSETRVEDCNSQRTA